MEWRREQDFYILSKELMALRNVLGMRNKDDCFKAYRGMLDIGLFDMAPDDVD